MLTPAFEVHQNEANIIIWIKVPYAKVSDTDVYFDADKFKFYCQPYFLRLNLPGKVLSSDDDAKIKYDVSEGSFTITLVKATHGEHFKDLDLLTKLLAPKNKPFSVVPNVEVIGETESDSADVRIEDFDWELEQSVVDFDTCSLSGAKCGFGNMYSYSVFQLKEESSILFDIVDPNKKSRSEAAEERLKLETEQFSPDHYLADLYDDEEIQNLINYETEWDVLFNERKSDSNHKIAFTPEEKQRLIQLPNKEYILDASQVKTALLNIVDILYAFAYNKRTTMEENHVESGWNINKLSASLSWLENFTSIQSVCHSAVRRSLIYPLFRNWQLSMKAVQDTLRILRLGQNYVIKCFLEIYSIFIESDPRYILNDLFITDFCVWMQGECCSSKVFDKLADALEKVVIDKSNLNLDLIELEAAANLTLAESEISDSKTCVDGLCSNMSTLNLKNDSSSDAESDDTSESGSDNDDTNSCSGTSTTTTIDSDDDLPPEKVFETN